MNKIKTFISTDEAEANLNNDNYRFIDLREKSKYQESHIPHSIHIEQSYFIEKSDEGYNVIPNQRKIEQILSKSGVNSCNTIIFIDDVFNLNCSIATWTLHYFGFPNVKLIDGALEKWEAENRPMTKKPVNFPVGKFEFNKPNEDIFITKDEIIIGLSQKEYMFVDNRSEYAALMECQGGSIPHSIHFWWMDVFTEHPKYFLLRPKKEIIEELENKGITPEKNIVVFCENAPQSAIIYLVLKEFGFPNVKLYLAGFDEWRLICGDMFGL